MDAGAEAQVAPPGQGRAHSQTSALRAPRAGDQIEPGTSGSEGETSTGREGERGVGCNFQGMRMYRSPELSQGI